MRKIIFFASLLLASNSFYAQNVSDVLKYSSLQTGGTARSLGAGNAFGALGAEFATLSQNPAGLGVFRTNEFVATPSLRLSNTNARLDGNTNVDWEEQNSAFNFDNVGMVFHTPTQGKWKAFNVGLGLNRQNNYSQSIFYKGLSGGSIMTNFYKDAQQVFNNGGNDNDLDPFGSQLAWDANAIYLSNNQLAYDFLGNENATVDRSQIINTSGRMNDLLFSMAGNYDEKLMVGATVSVPFVNYSLEGEYREADATDQVGFFDDLSYTEYLKTQGWGVNLKLGVIYKVTQQLRLGAAFHTPTRLSLTDNYSNTFSYSYTDGGGSSSSGPLESPDGTSDYRLRTPWRASASAAFVAGKKGFLSADVELVDYSANRYNFTADVSSTENELYERELNNAIRRAYRQTVNVRLGGELAFNKFRVRGGMNLLGNPRSDVDAQGRPVEDYQNFTTAYTAGVGVRGESFYVDLGWRLTTANGSVSPYTGAPPASTETSNNDILLTVGFKF